jgi:hypothetical protein
LPLYNDVSDVITAHGFQPDTTPVDTLMAADFSMHLDVADHMADDDTPITEHQ